MLKQSFGMDRVGQKLQIYQQQEIMKMDAAGSTNADAIYAGGSPNTAVTEEWSAPCNIFKTN